VLTSLSSSLWRVQVFRGILENDLLKEFKAETHILRRLRHPNVILFMGTCTQKREMCIVTGTPRSPSLAWLVVGRSHTAVRGGGRTHHTEFMSRGSLNNLLKDETVELGWELIIKIVRSPCAPRVSAWTSRCGCGLGGLTPRTV
jgi:hypothetical protein